ncbi:MAG: Spy/CpxP family protein refolding chaperone [Planctomycetota bacterium]|jgi:Spy/CpxP family protein refolding chaperone
MSDRVHKVLTLLLAFSLAFNIAFAGMWVYRQAVPRPPGRRPGGPWVDLRLSSDQERQIRARWNDVRRRARQYREEAAKHRDELLRLMAADEPDDQAVLAQYGHVSAAERQMREMAIAEMLNTQRALSPEQRQKWFRHVRARAQGLGRGRRRRTSPPAGNGAAAGQPPAAPAEDSRETGPQSEAEALEPVKES